MKRYVLSVGVVVLGSIVNLEAVRADTVHVTVPVRVQQTQLVTQATRGTVECWVSNVVIQPFDATTARKLVRGSPLGSNKADYNVAGGAYTGTINMAIDLGGHSVAEARSWYCDLELGGMYMWGYQHDLSQPYAPESFGNMGGPQSPNAVMQHPIPH